MRKTGWLVLLVLVLLGGACSNSESGSGDDGGSDDSVPVEGGGEETRDEFVASDQPGVTDDTIRVGGVASVTNPLGGPYGQAFDGAGLYFDQLNADGGIYGRDVELVAELDDNTGFENQAQVTRLLTEEDVFAVVPVATLAFDGAQQLVDEGVPTFGWNIQEEWGLGENMYGMRGFLCFTCATPVFPWVVREAGGTNVGVLGYDVPQSSECAEGIQNAVEEYGGDEVEIGFLDNSLPYGVSDVSVQVSEMVDAGVDFVTTCMDFNGEKTVADEMRRQGMDAQFYRPNGYDQAQLDEFPDEFEGSIVLHQFWPFEMTTDQPEGMADYLAAVEAAGQQPSELSLAGWISADMFVDGLVGAGPEFTREGVISYLNSQDDYDADGILPGIDWTVEHETDGDVGCNGFSVIEDGAFVPTFGEDGKPFVCIDLDAPELPDDPEVRA
jgi:ABC-type branched-subunit amino acid transport system substrate-binding protein